MAGHHRCDPHRTQFLLGDPRRLSPVRRLGLAQCFGRYRPGLAGQAARLRRGQSSVCEPRIPRARIANKYRSRVFTERALGRIRRRFRDMKATIYDSLIGRRTVASRFASIGTESDDANLTRSAWRLQPAFSKTRRRCVLIVLTASPSFLAMSL